MKFLGYRRQNGAIGTRNRVLIFPTTTCAATVAAEISKDLPGTVCVSHPHGCGHLGLEVTHMIRTMVGFCSHPNVAGVLLVGLGCEQLTPEIIAEGVSKSKQRVEILSIQGAGGSSGAVALGKKMALSLLAGAEKAEREEADISELILGTKCGGSDAISGLTANAALGVASDLLVGEGGTVLLSEVPEMLGAEHVLVRRAASDAVGRRILEITQATEARLKAMGADIRGSDPTQGNIAGGISTLEEKSLGAIRKAGTTRVRQVVEFAERPSGKGLVIMDGPAHDVAADTGMAAAGAQVIVFTTGRGSVVGAPTVPIIKLASNSVLFGRMPENMDLNAGGILDGTETIQSMGEKIMKEIVEVASGKLTRAEILGHHEFAIHPIGPTM